MAAPNSPLLALPKELRLVIYEHLYPQVHPHPKNGRIEIVDANPPPKALIMTCKQIYHEVGDIYKTSYRRFWETSRFIVIHEEAVRKRSRDAIIALSKADTNHINDLHVISSPQVGYNAWLVHNKGGWVLWHDNGSGLFAKKEFRRYRRWLFRETPRSPTVVVPTAAAWDGSRSEEDLREACERYGCGVPMINQILHLLQLELVDLTNR